MDSPVIISTIHSVYFMHWTCHVFFASGRHFYSKNSHETKSLVIWKKKYSYCKESGITKRKFRFVRKGTNNHKVERTDKFRWFIAWNHQKLKDQTAQCMDGHRFGFFMIITGTAHVKLLKKMKTERKYYWDISAECRRLIQPAQKEITEGDGLFQAVVLC